MTPTLDIIVVNWNSGQQLKDCLGSITGVSRRGFNLNNVIVVDNASSDGSASDLGDLQLSLQVIRNKKNMGFGAACNQGAAESRSDFLLFVNPDCLLYDDSIDKPICFLVHEDNNEVGICGIQLIDENGSVWRSCSRFPTTWSFVCKAIGLTHLIPKWFSGYLMNEWDHRESRQVDHVTGAFYLVRRSLFEELGGFDEIFYVYLEDLDFSLRARGAGFRSYYLADTQAFHKGGGSSEQIAGRRIFLSLQSRVVYALKHFSKPSAVGIFLLTGLIEPISRVLLAGSRRSVKELRAVVEAYLLFWKSVPTTLRVVVGKHLL